MALDSPGREVQGAMLPIVHSAGSAFSKVSAQKLNEAAFEEESKTTAEDNPAHRFRNLELVFSGQGEGQSSEKAKKTQRFKS